MAPGAGFSTDGGREGGWGRGAQASFTCSPPAVSSLLVPNGTAQYLSAALGLGNPAMGSGEWEPRGLSNLLHEHAPDPAWDTWPGRRPAWVPNAVLSDLQVLEHSSLSVLH